MKTFINDYKEPTFITKEQHNCKIKDNSLNITVREIEPTRINKVGRTIVNLKQRFKRLANVPDRVRVIKVSNHLSGDGKKDLEKLILTEIRTYKGKQTIKVKTDIDSRCNKPL